MRSNSALEGFKFLTSLGAECQDFFDGTTVLALERLEQVQSLLQLRQPLRIQVDSVGIAGEFALKIPQESRGLRLKIHQRLCASVDSGQVLKGSAHRSQAGEGCVIGFAQGGQGGLREFQQSGRIGRAGVLGLQFSVFTGFQPGFGDLPDLMTKQVDLLLVGALIDDQGRLGPLQF
jgi:hypothetical protein